jgi:hypothetical protein
MHIHIQLLLRAQAQAQAHFEHEFRLGHDHASGRHSVTAVIVLRGHESITRQRAITHLRNTVLGSASVQESNDKGDADKHEFRSRILQYHQLIVRLPSPGTTLAATSIWAGNNSDICYVIQSVVDSYVSLTLSGLLCTVLFGDIISRSSVASQ